MLLAIKVLSLLVTLAGVCVAVYRCFAFFNERDRVRSSRHSDAAPSRLSLKLPAILVVVGLFLLLALSGAAQVPATHVAVVENTWTGEFFSLDPGTHIWPFEPKLVPLMTRTTLYDLRRRVVEIGASPVRENGVQADSDSPGRPVVFFWGRGWAYPNKAQIIELHRRYGADYLDSWVERIWVTSLKAVQGERPYDFVGNYRIQFQNLVEDGLQEELMAGNGEPLVFVSQLAIVDFDFSEEINRYLDTVAQKEFERQQAEQQIEINKKNQEAATIQAETSYITVKRAAEAEQVKRIAEAEGQAQAQERLADANAYETRVQYEAEAEGIRLVQQALARSPEGYLEYLRIHEWGGDVPTYWGGGVLPIINIGEPQP